MRRAGVLVAVVVAALAVAAPARADHNDLNIPWPQALPALPALGTSGVAHPVPNCPVPSIACVDDLEARLEAQWQAYDAACDHRAVMSLSYLYITRELRRQFAAGAFEDPEWMAFVVAEFSNEYFKAIADYDAGLPVAPAWKVALDAMTRHDATAMQDTLLFSQAHVGHDYPYVLASQGIRTPSGASRKHDHDQINEVNAKILDGVQDEVAARYDNSIGLARPEALAARRAARARGRQGLARGDLAPRRAAHRREDPTTARPRRRRDRHPVDGVDDADRHADPGLAQHARRQVRRGARGAVASGGARCGCGRRRRAARAAPAPGPAARRAPARP